MKEILPFMGFEDEAEYWNKEYERCFGHPPRPPIRVGTELFKAQAVQFAVMRHYVEQMKQMLERGT